MALWSFGGGRKKSYTAENWQKLVAVDDLQQTYDEQGWSGPLGIWRQRSVTRLSTRIRELHCQLKTPATLLDVACFSGDYFGRLMEDKEMAEMVGYTGVDVTPKFVENSARRWADYSNAKFQVGSALDLPFPADSFDMVFNSGMLIHIADPERCIQGFSRVAKYWMLVETTVNPKLKRDYIDENKSGGNFIDRVYRPDYIREIIRSVAEIKEETAVPYLSHQSILWEAVPFSSGSKHD